MPRHFHPLITSLALACCFSSAPAFAQSDSSTTAVPLPHEGGPMPRAKMPLGGVDDGMPRAKTPNDGVKDDGLPRAKMPEGGADTAGKKEECVTHEHGGETHQHCEEPAATGGDCITHEHGGESHEHCGGEPDHGTRGDLRPATDDEKGRTGGAFRVDESELGSGLRLDAGGVQFLWNGYLRVLGEVIENDPRSAFIGRNDGFRLGNARLGVLAKKGDLSAYIALEAALANRASFNDRNATFGVSMRDAFLRYDLSKYARITAGRFKAPYDLGELEVTALRTFIEQPLESRGVLPTQGSEVIGLSQERQIGVMVHQDHLDLTDDGFDVGYAIALTNGRTFELALNDNDRPAAFARVSAYYGPWVQLNVGGFTDSRTVGQLPNLFDEEVKGTEVSMLLAIAGMSIQGQLLFQNTLFSTSARPDVNSLGGHVQWSYELWGAWLGYRFAYFDPNTKDLESADAVMEHTIGAGYGLTSLPLRFMLNGTVALEQEGRKLDNNRLAILCQYVF